MADLTELAPVETPPDPKAPIAAGASGSPSTNAALESKDSASSAQVTPAKPANPLDAKLEELLAAERKVQQAQREADIKLKQATDKETAAAATEAKYKRFVALDEHLTKGEKAAAVRALLGEQLDEQVLFDLAPHVEKKELTVQEAVAQAMAEKERLATEAAEKDRLAREADQEKQSDVAVTDYLKKSATFLKANAGQFPLTAAFGCDVEKYRSLSAKWIQEKAALPEPKDILALIETEHMERLGKTPFGPEKERELSFEDHAAEAFNRNRPAGKPVEKLDTGRKSGLQEALENLEAYENEKRNRLGWR